MVGHSRETMGYDAGGIVRIVGINTCQIQSRRHVMRMWHEYRAGVRGVARG